MSLKNISWLLSQRSSIFGVIIIYFPVIIFPNYCHQNFKSRIFPFRVLSENNNTDSSFFRRIIFYIIASNTSMYTLSIIIRCVLKISCYARRIQPTKLSLSSPRIPSNRTTLTSRQSSTCWVMGKTLPHHTRLIGRTILSRYRVNNVTGCRLKPIIRW